MSTRYERIKGYNEKLWAKGSPVTINKGALLRDNAKDMNVLQLELENVTSYIITAVVLCIECASISNEIVETKEFTYLDLNVFADNTFGTQVPIQIDNKEARNFSFTVKKVYFKNGDIFDVPLKMTKIANPQKVDGYGNLSGEFAREVNKKNQQTKVYYKPLFTEGYWYCTCGRLNPGESEACGRCNINQNFLREISDISHLTKNNEEYLAQLRETERIRQEEERVARKARNKRIKKKILIAASLFVFVAGIAGLAKYVIIPMLTYNEAIKLISDEQYYEAKSLLENLENYKDSTGKISLCNLLKGERKNISNADIQAILNTNTEVNIIYDVNGGDIQEKSIYSKAEEKVELPVPQYEGYNFIAWQFESWRYVADEDCVEVCVKAIWEDLYHITYELNGGTANNRTEYHKDGETFELSNPIKEGYSFIGWTGTDLNGPTRRVVLENGTYGNKMYTANWEANKYSIFLSYEDENLETDRIEVVFGEEVILPDISKAGYEFIGWYNEEGKKFKDTSYKIAGDITLTPRWNPIKYVITYYLDGGKNSVDNRNAYNMSEKDITLANPTKAGYRFLGWYSDSSYKNKVTKIKAGLHEDLSLYAKWEIITYSVEYFLDGGTVSGTMKKTFTIKDLPLTLPLAEKSNFVFLGWGIGSAGGKTIEKINDCKNYKLYASYMVSGLRFSLSYDKSYYSVSSYAGTASEVVIPGYYKNLPVKKIGNRAFKDNLKLVSIYLPPTVLEIGEEAFSKCKNLQRVNMSEGLKVIKDWAFYECKNMTSVSFPDTLEEIGSIAFSGCEKLKEVRFPDGLKELGGNSFSSCSSLEDISIPKSVKILQYYTFSDCENLKSVHLQEGLEEIGRRAFENCKSLYKLIIPKSVKKVHGAWSFDNWSPFGGCSNLTIYCRAKTIPDGWEIDWNRCGFYFNDEECNVIWGYTGN